MAACRDGDTMVVTKLDRLARSLPDAREIIDDLTRRQVINGDALIDELDRLAATRGYPTVLRRDNGPELACHAISTGPANASACPSSRRASRDATATSNRSTPASATSVSTSTASGPSRRPAW